VNGKHCDEKLIIRSDWQHTRRGLPLMDELMMEWANEGSKPAGGKSKILLQNTKSKLIFHKRQTASLVWMVRCLTACVPLCPVWLVAGAPVACCKLPTTFLIPPSFYLLPVAWFRILLWHDGMMRWSVISIAWRVPSSKRTCSLMLLQPFAAHAFTYVHLQYTHTHTHTHTRSEIPTNTHTQSCRGRN